MVKIWAPHDHFFLCFFANMCYNELCSKEAVLHNRTNEPPHATVYGQMEDPTSVNPKG